MVSEHISYKCIIISVFALFYLFSLSNVNGFVISKLGMKFYENGDFPLFNPKVYVLNTFDEPMLFKVVVYVTPSNNFFEKQVYEVFLFPNESKTIPINYNLLNSTPSGNYKFVSELWSDNELISIHYTEFTVKNKLQVVNVSYKLCPDEKCENETGVFKKNYFFIKINGDPNVLCNVTISDTNEKNHKYNFRPGINKIDNLEDGEHDLLILCRREGFEPVLYETKFLIIDNELNNKTNTNQKLSPEHTHILLFIILLTIVLFVFIYIKFH